ncbi:MAG: IclR family transcriptional regulator [Alphaproteobacteria bacterium]|nr:IclR family transcriptional regulator [Alphaproteobacteria bacterium]
MTDASELVASRPFEKKVAKKRKPASADRGALASETVTPKSLPGSQTLIRGLDVLEAVASGATNLAALAEALDLNRSTTHRLAATLVGRRYLSFAPRVGYALGPKLLELGFQAHTQLSLARVARDHIEALAATTGDTVHLGVLDGRRALYLDKISGSRRVEISSRVGERQPLRSTGLGKALIMDETETRWRELYEYENSEGKPYEVSLNVWLHRMHDYVRAGCALDLEENEDRIRCVAAPVRDTSDAIVGAVSVSSAAQYMSDARMQDLAEEVRTTARMISVDLGWRIDSETILQRATAKPR